MSIWHPFTARKKSFSILVAALLAGVTLSAQQTTMSEFVLFGGTATASSAQTNPSSPGYAVQLGSSSKIQGGSIGSYKLVKSTGNTTINANIYSGGIIQLANSNTISGKIAAANAASQPGIILSVGSNADIGGNIDVKGNISIGSGTVSGKVTQPVGTTYSGPAPAGGKITGTPSLPVLPVMPVITVFQPYPQIADINSTRTITPGAYDDIKLTGNKTLTFNGTGVYVFHEIDNSGTNSFVFDFKNSVSGTIKIYIHNSADLDKISVSLINGGSANRIFTEVHGNCSDGSKYAFNISNGSSANAATKWLGTVWAPYAAINIGSGSGNSQITGALWSGTQVNIQCGVNIIYAPYSECAPPTISAGPDKPLSFENQTTLTGTSTTTGATFNWQAINGGVITSPVNAATINVSSAGTYVLTVTASANCIAKDTAVVTGKLNTLIGSELQSVFQNFNPTAPPSPFFVIQNDSIVIDIITKEGKYAEALALLTTPAYGLTNIVSNGTSNYIITGLFKISKLSLLNSLSSLLVYVRPYYAPFSNNGIVTSAGDTSVRSNLVRNGFSLLGEGIKVGVISDSYNTILSATSNPITNTAAQDVGNGDLPGTGNPNGYTIPVQVLKESPFKRSDEGRAMLQIIHDVAPKAELFFRTGFISAGDFAKGIEELKLAGCNIIVDDITFITEPFLKDGVVANAVDAVTAAGTTYFSAAGNFAGKSYENTFNAVAAPGGLNGRAHNFGGGDVFQSVNLTPGNYTIVLQWTDDIYSLGQTSTGGTKNDLDIYLTPNTDGTALFGFNRDNSSGDPIEIIPFTVTSTTQTNILIVNNSLTTNPARFKYIVFKGDIIFNEYATGGSTLVGQANSAGAIAVGAARYDKAPPFAGPLLVESFSSIGGTVVNNVQRNKPELVAPDGVNTTVNMGVDYDNNSYSNFFGTSAAAPHAAGVAALIMEGKKKFAGQQVTLPAEIRSILQTSAIDMAAPGFDFSTGYGFINADSAMRTFAKPDPTLIQLVVPAVVTPGPSPFTLTVTGVNLSSSSVIKFRDSTLATTILNSNTATAVVPAFNGNPVISVYTPPISASGLDGGTSDSLKFFSIVKKNITITADNKTKKYGQSVPEFTATILVDGVPLQNTEPQLSLADLGLTGISFTTQATATSDVGTYVVTPVRIFSTTDPVDKGFSELYNYTFTAGRITIEKLPVTVTAKNATVVYGEKIPDVQFSYQFDGTNIPDADALLNTIVATHQGQLAKDVYGNDIVGLVNKQAVTIVNGQAIPIVNGQAVTIVNGQAVTIVNGQAIPIVNGQAITIVNGVATAINEVDLTAAQINQLNFLVSSQSLLNTRKLYNKKSVNGEYVIDSTNVVDITQESILDYNINSAQTYMLSAVSNVGSRGLIDIESFANGQAVTIVNGQAVTIVNGQAVTIVNGQAVTIVNRQAVTIVNGQAIPIVNNENRTSVIIDSSEIGQGQNELKALNMITGLEVGEQYIIPGSLTNSNFEITHIAGVVTILPAPVIITVTAGQTKAYGSPDPVFTYTNNAGLTPADFTGSPGRATGTNVGTYAYTLGSLSAGLNYELILSTASPVSTFTITAKSVSITPAAGQSKMYGDADPVFTFTNNGGLTAANFTGKLGRVSGSNVGVYAYTLNDLSAGINYQLSLSGINTFAVTKAPLQVKADNKVIFAGDPLPVFTSTITGLKNAETPIVTYTLTPFCLNAAGEYTIKPLLQGFTNAANYLITYVNGTLYINPKGQGAKKLRPKLDCVEEVINPLPGQFRYIAHFICVNDNATTVYVPVGVDNKLSSAGGLFNGSAQPMIFKPGTTSFNVPFDGVSLRWEIRTYESNHKTSVASEASSNSSKCNYISGGASRQTELIGEAVEPVPVKVSVFPNPSTDNIIVNSTEDLQDGKSIVLYDAGGKLCNVKIVRRISAKSFVLDVSSLAKGIYLIRIKSAGGYQSVKIIKQ